MREPYEADGKHFVMVLDSGEDRVAKNLSAKGLGSFQSNAMLYSWRPRSGFTNNFWLNDAGMKLRKELIAERSK